MRCWLVAVALSVVAFAMWTWQQPAHLAPGSPERLPLAEPGVEGSVERLFQAVQGDGADAAGIDAWIARYRDGEPLRSLGEALVATPAFARAYGSRTDAEYVDRLYRHMLGRRPSAADRANWTGQLATGTSRAALLVALSESPEYVARTHTPAPTPPRPLLAPPGIEHSIARIYLAFAGQWPDRSALDANVQRYLDGTSLAEIADAVLASPEAARYRLASSDGFIDSFYDAGESRGALAVGFTESAEMLQRTRTAAPLPAPIPHKLFAVGDSVMLGAVQTIGAIPDWSVQVNARGCRQPTWRGDGCGALDIPSGVDALREAREAGDLGGAVVIHLGNNGPMSSEQFDAMMREVADQRLVFAVTLHEPRSYEGPNNDVIHNAMTRWPNLRVIDWHTFAAGHADWFGDGEGIHLSHTGAQALANLIAASLPQY